MSDYSNGQLISSTPSNAFSIGSNAPGVDNIRRTFGIGDKVAELAPETSIFFSYLSKLGKKSTDETVWRPLEYRNQWQRRNFTAEQYKVTGGADLAVDDITGFADGGAGASAATHVVIHCDYDKYGKTQISGGDLDVASDAFTGFAPIFLTKNQVLRIGGIAYKLMADPNYYKYNGTDDAVASTKAKAGTEKGFAILTIANLEKIEDTAAGSPGNVAITAAEAAWNKKGQVMGSQWGEATGAPDGFRDELSSVEFYTQIFKTAVPLMSGSMQATRYRGYANEWKRIYTEHLKAHKMDLENAFLFGHGAYHSADERFSWGIEPFIRNKGGKKYELKYGNTAGSGAGYDVNAAFTYDGMVDVMDNFMNYESGNSGQKLCLTSRSVINYLHKMGADQFVGSSLGGASSTNPLSNVFAAGLDVKKSSFMPIDITSISTSWGNMNFVAHPLFRGDMENTAVCVDLSNVTLRPLAGNGISRDTFIETNVQENDIDGRKDMIITETGLEVMLPETHAVIDFVS